jgi:hypothetical protein
MARQDVDIGVEGNDNTGDSIRESFRKVNENFQELYAVFGIGGQISFTDLSDVPDTYEGNENKIPLVRATATGMDFVTLASDSALDPADVDTIGFDYSESGKLVIRILTTRIQADPAPTLGGPLNAGTQIIANIGAINQDNVDTFNSVHGTNITLDDVVIDKAYADVNFQPRQKAGSGLRLDPEPANRDAYELTVESFSLGNIVITDHSLGAEFNSAPFTFNVSSGGTPPSNITDGSTYYVRIVDADTISLHSTAEGALTNTNRIIMSGGTGTFTITDNDYDPDLTGNWLSTVALPRDSVTRRQGDILEGALFAHDHPGDLAGIDTGIQEDLQLATKYYVDKQGIPPSQVNLYVSTSGDDKQTNTPAGKEGRSEPWAFRTVNAACRKAEEIMAASPYQAGPYQQTMTYGDGVGNSTVTSAGITAPVSGRSNARALILENKEFIQKEVIGFINTTYPDLEYNTETCERDVGLILDAVSLDILLGDNANFLSRTAGIRYYENPSARKAIGEQKTETVAGIEHAKKLVNDILNQREISVDPTALVDTLYQTRYTQYIEPLQQPDVNADNAADAKFDIILDIIDVGPLDAPPIVDGSVRYKLNVFNGNFGFIDQGDPTNADIIPGKVIVGKNSGAKARIVSYKYEADPTTTTLAENDEFEVQLLEPIEFEAGEELEYGNFIKETQISIRIESGIYEEDYPIRVPDNVSLKGDEFRRVIIRPKQRVSQSRYAETFFYRDTEFDDLVIVSSRITDFTVNNDGADATRAGVGGQTYTNVASIASTGIGTGATFNVVVAANGSVTVTLNQPGTDYVVGNIITISDLLIGGTGADDINITVDEISGGKEYVNPVTGNIDGYFGFHYLKNPNTPKNVGPGYQNAGGYTIAAAILRDNKEFIQEQVVEFINDQYPAVVYSPTKCARDVGLIVEALAEDLEVGGNEFSLEAQGEYYYGALPVDGSQSAATEAGINHIFTLIQDLFTATQPSTIYGVGLDYPTADVFNGSAESAAEAIAQNLIGTITFAFNNDYNPPLRNDQMDVFLMNNATILRNMTVQGHGGFMLVLDPEGQVLTKSPYVQTGSSFSKSENKQVFSGGLFVDAFTGNTAMRVDAKRDGDPFVLEVSSLGSQADPQGLFIRRPEVPAPFYIDGRRFQVNAVTEYDPDFGTAVLLLDKNSNDGDGFTGVTSALASGVDLDDLSSPIPITMQTAGNRSILGNDFTQINDLGYGLVAVNGALSEMVSMFTYYCRASYYSKNGSEIRSLTGSSCYGEFGLVAEGSDPNEIPDSIVLRDDMAQPAKAFTADIILTVTGDLTLAAGRELEQASSGATGTTTIAIDGRTVYLTDVTGIWDTTNTITDVTGGGSIALGANSVPTEVDSTAYTNEKEQLSAHLYDIEVPPSNRGEFDVYHPIRDIFARYEISNVETTDVEVGLTKDFAQSGGTYTASYTGISAGLGTGATWNIAKTVENGYDVRLITIGTDYEVGDTITFAGTDLGGTSPANDVTITVDSIDSNGGITDFTQGAATISVTGDTPVKDGNVYKVNFSTSDSQFSTEGILETDGILHGTYLQVRNNQTFILDDIARPDVLTIRPSTAVVFRENPGTVYRSISFLTADATGETLPDNQSLAGFDSTYDYVRLVVNPTKAQAAIGTVYDTDGITVLTGGTTMGNTAGDTTIAITRIFEENEITRLNNNGSTEAQFRPASYDSPGELEMVFSWQGKKHTVANYRGVKEVDVTEELTGATQANPVVITLASDINLVNGEQISFTGVGGMTELNSGVYYVNNVSGATAELYDDAGLSTTTNGTGFGAYTSGGFGAVPREVVQTTPGETDDYGIVDILDKEEIIYPASSAGIASTMVLGNENIILRAGLQEQSPGDVTINISTCRATGHDFLDVGTGGFNTSNYPNVIFGLPQQPNQANEVSERTKGRVFYVSTDQNGIFRVGRFFSVDQGTGTVSFSASIALSDVDGLGFKRGVVVTEFSTDTAMTDNASDTVPTESAVRGYVNRRLGFDQTGAAISNKIGPGVLAPNGSVPMTDDLNAASNTITNLRAPLSDSDAATKAYVDSGRGDQDTIPDLRDTEVNDYAEGQLLVATGLSRIILDADTIVSGPFEVGDNFTGSITGATGTIVDVEATTGVEGNIIIITYTPTSGTVSSGGLIDPDNIEVLGGAEALCIDGPVQEWGNGVFTGSGDIETSVTRNVTYDPIAQEVTDRSISLELNIKSDVIVNADVNSAAAIAQSKLAMNTAGTRANSTGITQGDLGLATFKDTEFTETSGFVELQTSSSTSTGIAPGKLQHIPTQTVLGRSAAGDGAVSAISFATIANTGGAVLHTDIPDTDNGAVIRTGSETYDITAITTTGSPDSIVKTDSNGSIQVNSLILGGDSNYEILALDTTELVFKTPAQGEILTAVGGGPSSPPDVNIPGSLNVGGSSVTQSTLHTASNYNGEGALAADWIYSGFIEAPGEKGSASTGIAIGADTGLTTAGQVAIAVADSVTSSTFTPFIFSSGGVIPDQDSAYNIGSSTRKYNTMYATVFSGTATQAQYADLAENYLADTSYEAGTVLVFGGNAEVTVTDKKGDTRVAGVVSTNPAHLMNAELEGEHVTALALQGRVPVKVLGKVTKGDMLVTSATPGYAVVNNQPGVGQVIGKALENKEDSGKGIVEAVVGRV